VLTTGATAIFELSATPDHRWGSNPADAYPSFDSGRLPAVAFTIPSGALPTSDGTGSTLRLGLQRGTPDGPAVQWTATASPGVTVQPSNGSFAPGTSGARAEPGTCTPGTPASTDLTVANEAGGTATVTIDLSADGRSLPPVVVEVRSAG
jgi:hypothetical protein